ncbi:bifunctional 2-polyprenyl-6-hydroxyphenol methylase/3-demethylubiquinol 3-O-methyltransferase UbiG [Magnetococcales bacterium HHB-1]
MSQSQTLDRSEIEKFSEMAHEWWDPLGKFKPLHQINPLRVDYIVTHLMDDPTADLSGKKILDVGCGGGLLAEAMSERQASVMAIDASENTINIAKAHQQESGSDVDYRQVTVETLIPEHQQHFDAVLVMELLEHVANPEMFINDCLKLVKPGGQLFFSTLNRTIESWLLAIVMAEYVLNWLPRGTHQYNKFIKPSEISRWLRQRDILVKDISGIRYNPFYDEWTIKKNASVNYIGCAAL